MLNDPRVVQTMVKGDLIIQASDRIKTRSQTKQSKLTVGWQLQVLTRADPDQYTIIPAPLKIVKVLIEELLSASGIQNAASQAAAAAEFADDEDDDGWEDVPNTLDLGLGMTKEELMVFADGSANFVRQRDDETQAYLTEFFIKAANENTAGFNELYAALTEDEKLKLQELAHQ
jgi:importin-9